MVPPTDCDDSHQEVYYVLDLLMTPGVTGRVMISFLRRHRINRYCVTRKSDTRTAYAEFCQRNLADDCTVNTVQFCGHPQTSASPGDVLWAAAANAPPRTGQSFPLIESGADGSAVEKVCQKADADFKPSTGRATTYYDPSDKSRALASFMCLQRGKTQALNADRSLGSRVLSVTERVDRSSSLDSMLNAASSAGRVVGGTVGRLTPYAGAAIGAAMAPVVLGPAGMMGGAMFGAKTATTFGSGANSPSHKADLASVGDTYVSRRNRSQSLLSPQDTAVWRCLTRPKKDCNIRESQKLHSLNVDKGVTEADVLAGKLNGGIASFLPYATSDVMAGNTLWTQVDAIRGRITQRDLQNTEQTIANAMCANSQNLRTSEFDDSSSSSTRENSKLLLLSALGLTQRTLATNDMFRAWTTTIPPKDPAWTRLLMPPPSSEDGGSIISQPKGREAVAIAAQPMYVKLGRLFEIEAILLKTAREWTGDHRRINLAALGMPARVSPSGRGRPSRASAAQPELRVPPLLKIWHFLSGDAHPGGQRVDLYWNLDYACALTQSYLRPTPSPLNEELRGVPGFTEAFDGWQAAIARYRRCQSLLKNPK